MAQTTQDPELVRLRADPKRLRIGVRRMELGDWRAEVKSLETGYSWIEFGTGPRKALVKALRNAHNWHLKSWIPVFPGLDLGMDWTYPHPQRLHAA